MQKYLNHVERNVTLIKDMQRIADIEYLIGTFPALNLDIDTLYRSIKNYLFNLDIETT